MENQTPLTFKGPLDGDTISMVGDTYRILVSGKETNGVYAAIDMLIPPNGGPGPHAHAAVQEAFYILEGELEVKTQNGAYTAKKGAYVNIPLGGLVHQFKNKTNTLVHMVCIVTPAGMEDMFREIGQPVAPGEFLPPPQLGPDELKKFMEIAERYGQKLYPPDYLG
jgi:quercetin dioxygenase-like cupin family protein